MSFKLFDVISVEENNTIEDFKISASEYLANEELSLVTMEAMEEVEKLNAMVEDAEFVIGSLTNQVAIESKMDDKVDANTVLLSLESLTVVNRILGTTSKENIMSLESIEEFPGKALSISIEEKESLIKRIIASIKVIIAKVIMAIKKISVKVSLMFDNSVKKAQALKQEINASAPVDSSESSAKLEKIGGDFSILGLAGTSNDISADKIVGLSKVYGYLGDSTTLATDLVKNISSAISKLTISDVENKNFKAIENIVTEYIDGFKKYEDGANKLPEVLANIAVNVEKEFGKELPKLDTGFARSIIPFAINGKTYNTIVLEYNEKIDTLIKGDMDIKQVIDMVSKNIKVYAKTFELKRVCTAPIGLTGKECHEILDNIIKFGNTSKTYANGVLNNIDMNEKILDAIGKTDWDTLTGLNINAVLKPATTIISLASTQVSLGALKTVLNYNTKLLNTVNTLKPSKVILKK